MRHQYRIGFIALLLLLSLNSSLWAQESAPVPTLIPEIINVFPHDGAAFTQGLLYFDGLLYESTGLRGESSLREVDPTTGEVLRILPINRPAEQLTGETPQQDYFAEGLERVDNRLIQLTWTEGEAFVYDLATFERLNTFNYEGEGWGLCYDGRYLFMSDSTSYLSLRDAETFDLIVKFLVTIEGQPLRPQLLNELECVDEHVYANLWNSNFIAQIDKYTGQIIALIDASSLLTPEEQTLLDSSQVLNGIAYNPDTETFFITGKQWTKLFEVRFVPKS